MSEQRKETMAHGKTDFLREKPQRKGYDAIDDIGNEASAALEPQK